MRSATATGGGCTRAAGARARSSTRSSGRARASRTAREKSCSRASIATARARATISSSRARSRWPSMCRWSRRGARDARRMCARCSSRARADAALVAGMLHDESTSVRAIKTAASLVGDSRAGGRMSESPGIARDGRRRGRAARGRHRARLLQVVARGGIEGGWLARDDRGPERRAGGARLDRAALSAGRDSGRGVRGRRGRMRVGDGCSTRLMVRKRTYEVSRSGARSSASREGDEVLAGAAYFPAVSEMRRGGSAGPAAGGTGRAVEVSSRATLREATVLTTDERFAERSRRSGRGGTGWRPEPR